MMARNEQVDWSRFLPLQAGLGNVLDAGYGWETDGLVKLATAVGSNTESSWRAVEDYAKKRRKFASGTLPV